MAITRNFKTKKVIRTAGLMTGTSMDGLDISIADIGLSNNTADFNVIGTTSISYPSDLKFQIRQAVYGTQKNYLSIYAQNPSIILNLLARTGKLFIMLVGNPPYKSGIHLF